MLRRDAKPEDQEKTHQAVNLIEEIIKTNPSFDYTIWSAAMLFVVVNGFKGSGCSYTEFREEMKKVCNHYEKWWDLE